MGRTARITITSSPGGILSDILWGTWWFQVYVRDAGTVSGFARSQQSAQRKASRAVDKLFRVDTSRVSHQTYTEEEK